MPSYPTNLQAPMVRDPDTNHMVLVLELRRNPAGLPYLMAIEPCDGEAVRSMQRVPFTISCLALNSVGEA